MENRREEILGLKRLLVSVIVTALLITMLPFENMGIIVAKAEETMSPSSEFWADAETTEIEEITIASTRRNITKTLFIFNLLKQIIELRDFQNTHSILYPRYSGKGT